jgi:LysM repeat protein
MAEQAPGAATSRNANWRANPPGPQPQSQSPQPPSSHEEQTYQVQAGDTLSGIAARFLGSGALYMEIYSANRDQLKTPNDLRAGMTIRIPKRDAVPAPFEFTDPSPKPSGESGARRATRLNGVELHPVSVQSSPAVPKPLPVPALPVEVPKNAVKASPVGVLEASGNPSPPVLRAPAEVPKETPPADAPASLRERAAPVKVPASESAKPAPANPPAESEPHQPPPTSPARKFVPVRRNPLAPRAGSPEAVNSTAAGKTLSQIPPADLPPLEPFDAGLPPSK